MLDLRNSFVLLEVAKSRHKELMKEAEEARLARLVRKGRVRRPWLQQRLACAIGDLMIAFGHRLKAREEAIR